MARTVPTYDFRADWNNDGDYNDTGETLKVSDDPGFVCERGRDQIRALAPPMTGSASLTVDNRDRTYSPDNTGSPIAANLVPGRAVRAQATFGATTYPLWRGVLDDIEIHPERGQRTAVLPCLGALSRLRGKKVSTGVLQNVRTDQAITAVLDAAGWPAGERAITSGKTILLYWWAEEDDAWNMIVTLLNTEGPGAAVYERGDGYFVFEHRHYRLLTARCTTSQATFRDSGNVGPWHTLPFGYNPGLKGIVNEATIAVNARTVAASGVVWQYGESAINIGANETASITAKASDPFIAAIVPSSPTDFAVTNGSITGVTLARTSGMSTTINLTAGAGGASIADLQLRAQSLPKSEFRVTSAIDASASQAKYGLRTYPYETWPEIDPNVARDFANAIVASYQEKRATVSITTTTDDDSMSTHVFAREISDRITVVEAQSGLNADVYIERIRHEVTKQGKRHVTSFGCERATNLNFGAWGAARWNQSVWGF